MNDKLAAVTAILANFPSEPDRKIDAKIAVTLEDYFEIPPRFPGDYVSYGFQKAPLGRVLPGADPLQLIPHYTNNTDAAIALAKNVLPQARITICDCFGTDEVIVSIYSLVKNKEFTWVRNSTVTAQTIPLATIQALLTVIKTKIEREINSPVETSS